ncbi:hypothetical protein SPLC1_S260470 [Arthrospira platensis C1]|uniref:Uncharacterized protein n=1 Tax=Limnospira indica PCC 8005 TaxID=376219 RepID=A0A9P1KHM8_9CYAN|nr:hypothetical protein SPLC1_S260470 [Arthrospira platensis C1]CDM97200.1 conserved protein of unknown function [Limnospira indica PCC 8005]
MVKKILIKPYQFLGILPQITKIIQLIQPSATSFGPPNSGGFLIVPSP